MNNKNFLWSALGAVVFVAVISLVFVSNQTAKENSSSVDSPMVRVGFKKTLVHFPPFLAEAEGYFNAEGIRVEFFEFQSTNEMIDAVVARRIDATSGGAYEPLLAAESRSPHNVQVYYQGSYIADNFGDYLIVPTSSAVKDVAGLKGKRVVVLPGQRVYAQLFLRQFGFNENDAVIDQIDAKFIMATLASGDADAALLVEPLATTVILREIGKVLLAGPYTKNLPPSFAEATLAGALSSSFVQEYPETARKYVTAINKAITLTKNNPTRVREILPGCCGTEPDVAQAIPHLGVYKTVAEIDREAVQNFADFLLENGVLLTRIDIRNLFYEL